MSKRCTKCEIIKNLTEFYKNYSECKECTKKRSAKYYNNNKDKAKIWRKNYNSKRRKNIEKCLLDGIRYRLKQKNILCTLTIDDIKKVMPKDNICPLLNIEMKKNNKCSKYNSFTVDRIDNNKLYEDGNIWIISKKANSSKSNSTIEEYKLLVNNFEKILNGCVIAGNGDIEDYIIGRRLIDIKRKSIKLNLPFNIDKKYLKSIYPKNGKCPLLNIDMIVSNNYGGSFNSPSVDRMIPEKGYIKENLIWISKKANTIKSYLSIEEMKLLLDNWKRKLQE